MKASKLVSWIVLTVVLTAPGLAFAEGPAESLAVPAEAAAPAPDLGGSCNAAPAEDPLFASSCALCPSWAPSCKFDAQCDTFCGGVGYGACMPFQACTRCCGCRA